MINAIIVEDEPKAIELLENYSRRIPEIKIIATFRNPLLALEHIQNNNTDLILLDINMPKLNGIQFAKLIPEDTFFIFTTAYTEFAVQSYDLKANDYLLKPITFKRFLEAIHKIQELKKTAINQEHGTIVIKSGYDRHRISLNDILYLKKDGNYIFYHTIDKKIMARETIKESLSRLPKQFLQVHKSYIVAKDKIDTTKPGYIIIKNTPIPLSKKFKHKLV